MNEEQQFFKEHFRCSLDLGWVYIVFSHIKKDKWRRVQQRVLEILTSDFSDSSKSFLMKAQQTFNQGWNSSEFSNYFYLLVLEHIDKRFDPVWNTFTSAASAFEISKGVKNLNYGSCTTGVLLLSFEYLKNDSNSIPISILSDLALELGYCSSPPKFPGAWAYRQSATKF